MKPINQSLLKKFLELAGDKLEGQWILMGGTVLPLLGIDFRVTNDIDMAGPENASHKEMLALMEIAEQLGLPVETINQAGGFFLRRIKGWKRHIVLLHQGKKSTIYRPDATLFILLKLERISETDVEDCLKLLKYAKTQGETIDTKRLSRHIRKMLKQKPSSERETRLRLLLSAW